MNGSMLRRWFYHFLDTTEANTDYAPLLKAYDCLDMAASIFVRETRVLHDAVELVSEAGRQNYALPPDFLDLYIQNHRGRFCIRYNDGENLSTPFCVTYEEIFLAALADAQESPDTFAISEIGPSGIPAAVSGTVTATTAASGGRSILTDTAKDFSTLGIFPRDTVRNAASGALGLVLEVIDAIHLAVAIFTADGAPAGWTSGDAYTIQSATKHALVLPAPSAVSGHTLTVPYICMPRPVYTDDGVWPLSSRSCEAIAAGAAALFKLPKTEFVESQALGGLFNEEIRRLKIERGQQTLKQGHRRRERLL